MKKTILIFAALLMVVSGVAAVSAYEAHVINVTAHVENALTVDTDNVTFGTMFPQEWRIEKRAIKLSQSANETLGTGIGDLDHVDFTIFAEWKIDDGIPANHSPDVMIDFPNDGVVALDCYAWIGEWLWVGLDATTDVGGSGWYWVGPEPVGDNVTKTTGLIGTLDKDWKTLWLDIAFLAPVFEDYYNVETDVKPEGWPFTDWAPIPKGDARWLPAGVDLGVDLKIQVTEIARVKAQ